MYKPISNMGPQTNSNYFLCLRYVAKDVMLILCRVTKVVINLKIFNKKLIFSPEDLKKYYILKMTIFFFLYES